MGNAYARAVHPRNSSWLLGTSAFRGMLVYSEVRANCLFIPTASKYSYVRQIDLGHSKSHANLGLGFRVVLLK